MFTATPESPCALTLIELLLVDGVDSVDGWGEFEDPLREGEARRAKCKVVGELGAMRS